MHQIFDNFFWLCQGCLISVSNISESLTQQVIVTNKNPSAGVEFYTNQVNFFCIFDLIAGDAFTEWIQKYVNTLQKKYNQLESNSIQNL